jgi:antitoxin YefM
LYKEIAMEALSYSRVRQNLAKTLDKVCEDHAPVIVTRQGDRHSPVVIMSLEDYQAMEETAYLLRSPRNARRLIESVVQLEEGRGAKRDLAE